MAVFTNLENFSQSWCALVIDFAFTNDGWSSRPKYNIRRDLNLQHYVIPGSNSCLLKCLICCLYEIKYIDDYYLSHILLCLVNYQLIPDYNCTEYLFSISSCEIYSLPLRKMIMEKEQIEQLLLSATEVSLCGLI